MASLEFLFHEEVQSLLVPHVRIAINKRHFGLDFAMYLFALLKYLSLGAGALDGHVIERDLCINDERMGTIHDASAFPARALIVRRSSPASGGRAP